VPERKDEKRARQNPGKRLVGRRKLSSSKGTRPGTKMERRPEKRTSRKKIHHKKGSARRIPQELPGGEKAKEKKQGRSGGECDNRLTIRFFGEETGFAGKGGGREKP